MQSYKDCRCNHDKPVHVRSYVRVVDGKLQVVCSHSRDFPRR